MADMSIGFVVENTNATDADLVTRLYKYDSGADDYEEIATKTQNVLSGNRVYVEYTSADAIELQITSNITLRGTAQFVSTSEGYVDSDVETVFSGVDSNPFNSIGYLSPPNDINFYEGQSGTQETIDTQVSIDLEGAIETGYTFEDETNTETKQTRVHYYFVNPVDGTIESDTRFEPNDITLSSTGQYGVILEPYGGSGDFDNRGVRVLTDSSETVTTNASQTPIAYVDVRANIEVYNPVTQEWSSYNPTVYTDYTLAVYVS